MIEVGQARRSGSGQPAPQEHAGISVPQLRVLEECGVRQAVAGDQIDRDNSKPVYRRLQAIDETHEKW